MATPAGELMEGENEAMDTVVGGPEPEDLHIMGLVTMGDEVIYIIVDPLF